MTHWIRFEHQQAEGFGTLDAGIIRVHRGDMFRNPEPTGDQLPLASVRSLIPCLPGKMIGLWNNFHERAAVEGLTEPEHPLYFFKAGSSFLAGGETIRRPSSYDGMVVFEGELGVVIGRQCSNISEQDADDYIFGYTCVNDVTARGILRADPSFPQWARAKSFDGFGVFGPVIATGLDPSGLRVRSLLDRKEMQNYPVTDMFFQPRRLVSLLSRDMTLNPGDLIACGTSVGAGGMPEGCEIEIFIDGVGRLTNRFE